MRDLTELNLNQGGQRVRRARPTPTQLCLIETIVGAKLPEAYAKLLEVSNGGHPELDTFHFGPSECPQEWSINLFFHVSSETGPDSVLWNYNHRWPGAPREVLPIGNDGLGNLICLDLTEGGRGAVIIWVHDMPGGQVVRAAESLEQLLANLGVNPDFI
jgi:hypothetical protein